MFFFSLISLRSPRVQSVHTQTIIDFHCIEAQNFLLKAKSLFCFIFIFFVYVILFTSVVWEIDAPGTFGLDMF